MKYPHLKKDLPKSWGEEWMQYDAEIKRLEQLEKIYWRILIVVFLITVGILAWVVPAKAEPQFYGTVNIASLHINATRDFNEFNPGLGLGVTWGSDTFRYGVEAGFFENSYSHQSTYITTNWRWRVADFENVGLWAGGFVGFADYPNLTGYADKFGIPRIGDHIMIGGFAFTAEFERVNWTLLYTPVGSKMDGVFGLKASFPFGSSDG